MNRDQIYWDSDVFLCILNDEDDRAPECERVLLAAQAGTIQIVTSALTLAEVLYLKGQPKLDPFKRGKVDNFFKADYISVRNVTRLTSELARDLVWDSNIRPKDAIHVATACLYRLKLLNTYDEVLLKAGSVTLAGHTVKIAKPKIVHQEDWVESKDGKAVDAEPGDGVASSLAPDAAHTAQTSQKGSQKGSQEGV